jgi:hypothetical protein
VFGHVLDGAAEAAIGLNFALLDLRIEPLLQLIEQGLLSAWRQGSICERRGSTRISGKRAFLRPTGAPVVAEMTR